MCCLQTGVQLDASYRALTQQRHQQANERTRTAQQVDAQDILNAQRNARLREPASMKSAIKRNVSLTLHSVPCAKAKLIMCFSTLGWHVADGKTDTLPVPHFNDSAGGWFCFYAVCSVFMQTEAKIARANQIKLDSEQLERLLFQLFERKVGPLPSSTTRFHDMTFSVGQPLAERAVQGDQIHAERSMWFAAILENE